MKPILIHIRWSNFDFTTWLDQQKYRMKMNFFFPHTKSSGLWKEQNPSSLHYENFPSILSHFRLTEIEQLNWLKMWNKFKSKCPWKCVKTTIRVWANQLVFESWEKQDHLIIPRHSNQNGFFLLMPLKLLDTTIWKIDAMNCVRARNELILNIA